eukprot:CAMPEP_0168572516 /NCGR_PEP_ID=MMETSP0413-20121227/17981_1 /TAXON_ID=136452 /ORGANISM="Filamoeba nolandi, Strain NC-AS-23-1" /LENGTH=959 /DNA_ID=CAMNT_0008605581 /DNA_START=106 /DNA_END=2981 /DNA_ORIENTATION=+
MDIVLVVKKDNRKKHNSHEWFFSEEGGFCYHYQPEFCLATDCSTIFHPKCIKRMAKVLIRDDNCAVCTGRQVCMSAEQQGSEDSWIEWLYRQAQTYDFESSFSNFMGAFAIFGFLPVVPGPCGLYRWKLMTSEGNHEGPLRWYFRIVNTPAEDCGLILANLKIAEDRILSYSAVLKTTIETTMQIAPDAEFYFEAETDLELFVKQRRRWINGTFAGYVYMIRNRDLIWSSQMSVINGTFAGYVYMIRNRDLIWGSQMSAFRKLAVFFLILCQLGIYGIVFVTPAIFLSALYSILFWIFPPEHYLTTVPNVLWIAYVIFYAYFNVSHTNNAYIGWSFYVLMVLSMFTMVGTFVGSIFYLSTTSWTEANWISNLPITVTLAVMTSPLIISIHRPASWLRSIKSVVPFYLFLPTLVAWFGSYSVARFSDITWGNRPAGEQSAAPGASSVPSEAMKRVKLQASTWAAFVILANLVLILLCIQNNNSKYFIAAIALLVCSFSGIQITISAFYFFFHFLLEKFVFFSIGWVIRKTLEKMYFGEFQVLPDEPQSFKVKPNAVRNDTFNSKHVLKQALMLSSFQFAINFCWQYIFQIVPVIENNYKDQSDRTNAVLDLVYPLMGLLYIVMGKMGDYYAKGSEKSPFRKIAFVGVAFYVIITITFEFARASISDSEQKYMVIRSQTYLQALALNISGAAFSVLFLTHSANSKLIYFVAIKSLLGALGNLISSIITLSNYSSHVNQELLELMTGVVCCLLQALSMYLVWCATPHMPKDFAKTSEDSDEELTNDEWVVLKPSKSKGWTDRRIRRVAIVLATYFFFSAGLAAIQFGLSDFFTGMDWDEDTAFRWTEGAFIGQEAITFLAGLMLFRTKRANFKRITVVLSLTSLAQLLLFSSKVATNEYLVIALVIWFGLYRTVPEVFCFYFFAREVQLDNTDGSNHRIGFWVAAIKVTLVIAQMIGYPALG